MTDQNNSNSTSDKDPVVQEPVTEYTLAENFMRQYKKMKLGMLQGEFLTVREQQALTASMIGQPAAMPVFIINTLGLIQAKAIEEFPIQEEMLDCVAYFNTAIYSVVFTVVIPLLKMPEETKKAIRAKYLADQEALKDIDKAKGAEEAPLDAGLDFDMPDLKPYIHPDS